MRFKSKTDKGVAGLTILLSLVTMLFVIGLLVMIFSLMGGELQDATYDSTTVSVTNESITFPSTNAVQSLDYSTYLNVVCSDVSYIANATTTGVELLSGNVTQSACTLTNATALSTSAYGSNGTIYVSYTYTYDATNTATDVMNDTTVGISSVTDWFAIFVVIGAMVVLILLTVIIITAIRGSGLMAGGSA